MSICSNRKNITGVSSNGDWRWGVSFGHIQLLRRTDWLGKMRTVECDTTKYTGLATFRTCEHTYTASKYAGMSHYVKGSNPHFKLIVLKSTSELRDLNIIIHLCVFVFCWFHKHGHLSVCFRQRVPKFRSNPSICLVLWDVVNLWSMVSQEIKTGSTFWSMYHGAITFVNSSMTDQSPVRFW